MMINHWIQQGILGYPTPRQSQQGMPGMPGISWFQAATSACILDTFLGLGFAVTMHVTVSKYNMGSKSFCELLSYDKLCVKITEFPLASTFKRL